MSERPGMAPRKTLDQRKLKGVIFVFITLVTIGTLVYLFFDIVLSRLLRGM